MNDSRTGGRPRTGAALIVLSLTMAVLSALAISPNSSTPQSLAANTTLSAERLGNPFAVGLYARNVWDMQLYEGRIYLGHGNSSNQGPDQNAGPIPIWAYDISRSAFVKEYTTGEEQVDLFRVLDGTLYVPGHDPRGSPAMANFYRRDATGWSKLSTIPNALHVYDLALFDGRLFAAAGPTGLNAVMSSTDGGLTWNAVLGEQNRFYTLFQFKGRLYAMKWVYTSMNPVENGVDVFDGQRFVDALLPGAKMLPGMGGNRLSRLVRVTESGGQLIYIAADFVNDHQWHPVGLYVAPEPDQARQVSLPDAGALPYDILVRGTTVYLLAALRQPSGAYTNLVYTTTDLRTWRELFRFTAPTFARSFEELNGDFYFGLGTTTTELSLASGDILRVRRTAYGGGTFPATPTRAPAEGPRRVYLPLLRADGRRGVAIDSGAYPL